MTTSEFSNEFDVYYNSITSNQAPGLDEYEKSVFLTKAQEELVTAYFNPRKNKTQEGFDDTEIRQMDFSNLIKVVHSKVGTGLKDPVFDHRKNSKSIALPDDLFILVNEEVSVIRNTLTEFLQVLPISYDEYRRLMSKPYKRPLKFQAWRLINNSEGSNTSDIIVGPGDTIQSYKVRYVQRPSPIILEPVSDPGLSLGGGYIGADSNGNAVNINDSNKPDTLFPLECKLNPILHPDILQRAVELAKAAYQGDLNSQVALGQASQTDLGIVTQSR